MDEGRLREVYTVAYPRLVGQLTGVTGDPAEAEDVVMEAFARAAPTRSCSATTSIAIGPDDTVGQAFVAGERLYVTTYGLMNGPIYYSEDDGHTWHETVLPGNED